MERWSFLHFSHFSKDRNKSDIQKNTILEPTSSNIAPKTLPRQPPGLSRGGPNAQKTTKSDGGLVVLHFSHFSKDREKSDQKCSQDPPKAPKLSPTWSSWRYHGPSWAQLAANLAHLASILGPSSPQLRQKSPPNRARNLKKRPQRPQDHPGGRQRAPGQPLGPEFSRFRGRFWTSF